MQKQWILLVDVLILAVVLTTMVFLYRTYSPQIIDSIFGTEKATVFFRDVPLLVSVADDNEERKKGLSNVQSLPNDQGMLFIFEREGNYRFWMEDTLIALDIFWINDDLKVVHIEKNVRPETYPASFGSPVPARFVIETNAFFADTFRISVGDEVKIPNNRLPADLR